MKLHTAHAALTLAAIVTASAATPSFAKAPHVYVTQSAAMAYGDGNIIDGHYAPGSTGYGRWAYNPEQPTDPDPRIGGSLKLSTDR